MLLFWLVIVLETVIGIICVGFGYYMRLPLLIGLGAAVVAVALILIRHTRLILPESVVFRVRDDGMTVHPKVGNIPSNEGYGWLSRTEVINCDDRQALVLTPWNLETDTLSSSGTNHEQLVARICQFGSPYVFFESALESLCTEKPDLTEIKKAIDGHLIYSQMLAKNPLELTEERLWGDGNMAYHAGKEAQIFDEGVGLCIKGRSGIWLLAFDQLKSVSVRAVNDKDGRKISLQLFFLDSRLLICSDRDPLYPELYERLSHMEWFDAYSFKLSITDLGGPWVECLKKNKNDSDRMSSYTFE